MTFILILIAGLQFSSTVPSAVAGEGLFSRAYTTETEPAGHFELEQLVRNRRDRSFGSYSALDLSTEVEYGFTDAFQGALYLNTGHIAASGAPDDDDPNGSTPQGFSRNAWFMTGISAEFIYRFLSPITDPIGLAVYFEPAYNWHDFHDGLSYDKQFEWEYRVMLQKNFFEDQLIVVYNIVAEVEFNRFEGETDYAGELDFNNEIGATYRVASNWYTGLEFRNHNEIGNFNVHEHSIVWAGPVVHYGGQKFWATLGALYQVWGGGDYITNGVDENGNFVGDHTFLRSHERWELTAKVGLPF